VLFYGYDFDGQGPDEMKLAGFLLLPAGWGIVLSAVALLSSPTPRAAFVLAGVAVEVLGLILAVRSHVLPRPEREREHS